MKNIYALVAFFCLISSVACSMNNGAKTIEVSARIINVDVESQNKLVKAGAEEIFKYRKGYWPEDAVVSFDTLHVILDQYEHTENPRYAVTLTGRYVQNGMRIARPSTGTYWKHELVACGVTLPDNK